jgi:hypothetical protein
MFGSPRPACGERSDHIADVIRVRGLTASMNLWRLPLTRLSKSELRSSRPGKRGEGEEAGPSTKLITL